MIRGAIAAAAAAVACSGFAAPPVAFVADVAGSAMIAGDGKVAFLGELEAGTRLFLGTGAKVAVTFARSGSEFTASGPGEYLVTADELRAEKGLQPVRREVATLRDAGVIARLSRSATASLRMRGVAPADKPIEPRALEYPVETRIATLQPELRWSDAGEKSVQVVLRDEGGRTLWSGRVKGTTAKPRMKLTAATRYTWTVMTSKGKLDEASFETLAAEPLAAAQRSQAASRSFSERVLHAVLLDELGAEQDARRAWAQLARERPDLPELARLAAADDRRSAAR